MAEKKGKEEGSRSYRDLHTPADSDQEHFEISLKYFDILGILGEGAFGKVKRIERKKKNHAQYALKYIDKKKCIEKHATTNIFRERMVLQALHHQYIVNLKYAFQDDENLFMVLDLAEGGDLRCHLDRMKVMKEDTLLVYTAEISYALWYLHDNKIIHRDLKPENLLLDKDGHILLTDFNVCANLKDSQPSSPSGTRPYMAPEMFNGKPYSYAVDWWAVGIILYECTWGRRPYKVEKDWTVKDFESVPVSFPDMVQKTEIKVPASPSRDSFIKGLLSIDRYSRLGSSNHFHGFEKDIKVHDWLSKIDWSLIEQKKLQPTFKPNAKALNIDSALLIDEIIGGGDGLSYKVRKADKKPSAISKAVKGLKKMLGIKTKVPKPVDPNAPLAKLSPEDQQMSDMDNYYTSFNWELPDQKPMQMPPKPKKEKEKKNRDDDSRTSSHQSPKDDEKEASEIKKLINQRLHSDTIPIRNSGEQEQEEKKGDSAETGDVRNVLSLEGAPDQGEKDKMAGDFKEEEVIPVKFDSAQTSLGAEMARLNYSASSSNSEVPIPRDSVSNENRASRRKSRLSIGLVERGQSIKEEADNIVS